MAGFFLDSSAVVKRHVVEVGTRWVRRLTSPAAGHDLYLARITGAEVASALVRHQPALSPRQLSTALADLQHAFTRQYAVIPITSVLVFRAMALAVRYRLRGADAIQLAAALVARRRHVARGFPEPRFVSADRSLNVAAIAEGFAVDDPLSHP